MRRFPRMLLPVTAACGLANAAYANDFSEFEHPTVEFNTHVYTVPSGTRVCTIAETVEEPMEGCSTLNKPTPVKVIGRIHGVQRSYFLVRPTEIGGRALFVYREDLRD